MTNFLIWIFLIAIWNSILFYEKQLGISVILFIIPLLLLIYYILKSQNKIINKKGLLFMIPIILLSLTYYIFDSSTFRILNIPVLIILFLLMYIYTIKPTYSIKDIINDIVDLISKPLDCISNIFHLVINSISNKLKLSNNTKQNIKSLIIILPVVIIVLYLLSSADQVFESIFKNLFTYLEELSLPNIIENLIARLITITILFFYLSATISFLLHNFPKAKSNNDNKKIKLDSHTIKLLLMILNIIYIVFDIVQINSLILHQVSMDITYAEYAREGFFQLMFVSFINLMIILISKSSEDKSNARFICRMSITMIFLTLIIIISAFIRMYMYESQYGYTLLRLLVYITLITEIILLIPTIKYILNSKFNIVKSYMMIVVTIYTITNFMNVDYIIAYRNVNRYYEKNDIDLIYLKNDHTDNISMLVDLYHKTKDQEIKDQLDDYFENLEVETSGFQELNLSKSNAKRKLKSIQK